MVLDLIKLLLTLPFVFILPGLFLILAIFGWRSKKISFFEKAVLTVPLSFIATDLIVLLLNKFGIPIKGPVLIGSIAIFCLAGYIVYQARFKKAKPEDNLESEKLFDFSFWQTSFILLSLGLAVFIRVAYLTDTIIPSSTDLGHHMYWTQTIIESGRLPNYGVPDFIIGEHMPSAVVSLVSGVGLMTAMPTLVLLLANIVGIFLMAILVARFFENKNTTAIAVFIAGALYAISPPQGRYVSGGVVGNILGDMLIPVALYFLYRAFKEKDGLFAGLFVLIFAGLLYTHHLSAFMLIYSVAAIVVVYLAINFKQIPKIILEWMKIFLKPLPVAVILLGLAFLFFVFTPSYFNPQAVKLATGTPIKITRVGLSLSQIDANAGSARLLLGGIGAILLLLNFKPRKYEYGFTLGWALILFCMAWKPGWLFVNIPSDRIGNYLFLPLTALSAYGLGRYFEIFRRSSTKFLSAVLLYTILFFVITNGLSDSADVFKAQNKFAEIMQTFHSADYLAKTVDTSKDVILKDHVNIYGDSWYKLFFMKDYKYPLSRGVLSRYVDPTKPRETCTRDMITEPESNKGKACFADTGVNYVVVNAQIEGNSFESYPDFSKVYGSNYISIFKKN